MAAPSAERSEQAWLEAVRGCVLRADLGAAQSLLTQALATYPASLELQRLQAGVQQRSGRNDDAEQSLRAVLKKRPGDGAAAFSLARLLKAQDRMAAASAALRACLVEGHAARDANLAITAIDLLSGIDRTLDAAAVANAAIGAHPDDPRLHAYAGMLAVQLGEFDQARDHYLFALHGDTRAFEWHIPIGLASTLRYPDALHPDFALFRDGLERGGLSPLARAELHFALGKACDDVGDYARAARHFREGNALRSGTSHWSSKGWRRAIAARLAANPGRQAGATSGFTPVFIVGMPRSGTTLLAELLSRHPQTCNRGELPVLAQLAQLPALTGNAEPKALLQAAASYVRASRQDDAAEARWFIDKQPLNFRYVDLALALFPDAKIIHCTRTPRDTALSLWMQCFLDDVQGYAYDFRNIHAVMQDERRLMTHWQKWFAPSIRDVGYESLVASPQATVAALAAWIGLPAPDADSSIPSGSISSSSLWQARQPVYGRSVGRWQHYATLVPELATIAQA